MHDQKVKVASRLLAAERNRQSIDPVAADLEDNLDAAYDVQELVDRKSVV